MTGRPTVGGVALTVLAVVTSGCVFDSQPPCPTGAEADAAYAAGHGFFSDVDGERFSLKAEGTFAGEVEERLIIMDPEGKQMSVKQSETVDLRFRGVYYSTKNETDELYGRHHHPDGAMQLAYESFVESLEAGSDESGLTFASALEQEDFAATCTTSDRSPAIEFKHEDEGEEKSFVTERHAPYRLVSLKVVDPALKDNFRVGFSYDEPHVAVETSFPRDSATARYDVIDFYTNELDGIYLSAKFSDASHWVPFSEVRLDVSDGTTVYDSFDLVDGEQETIGGSFTYDDRDSNLLLSTGDTFTMDYEAGLDVYFFDEWAGAYAKMIGS